MPEDAQERQIPLSARRRAQWVSHVNTIEREYDKGHSVTGSDALLLASRLKQMLQWTAKTA